MLRGYSIDGEGDKVWVRTQTGGSGGHGEGFIKTITVEQGKSDAISVGRAGTNGADKEFAIKEIAGTDKYGTSGTSGGNSSAFGIVARGGGGGGAACIYNKGTDDSGWDDAGYNGVNGTSYTGGATAGAAGFVIIEYGGDI